MEDKAKANQQINRSFVKLFEIEIILCDFQPSILNFTKPHIITLFYYMADKQFSEIKYKWSMNLWTWSQTWSMVMQTCQICADVIVIC